MSLSQQKQEHQEQHNSTDFVLPFSTLNRDMLAQVGGKAANLGELISAKLLVPPGFCVTTTAYELVASEAGLQNILDQYKASSTEESKDAKRLSDLAQAARNRILTATIPIEIADAIIEAYGVLGSGKPIPVAVRSSATAEDLPFASFAGQQDTYLNIVGVEAMLDAVCHCWASLWTERAVSYRESLGIDQSRVKLGVVVQRMVEPAVAGVLFTANPLTGKRRQTVIDANPGLGEAVVSGATNPDHFVVNITTDEIVERRLGDKRVIISGTAGGGIRRSQASDSSNEACLTDEQIRSLTELGARVETYYGVPQDIEWAIDSSEQIWLTQSRPITTLYPLPTPTHTPMSENMLRVYLSLNVFQGVFQPFTPMGIAAFRLIGSAFASLFDLTPSDPLVGPPILIEAGYRLFFDVTAAMRTKIGRTILIGAMHFGEARSEAIIQQLTTNPRLSLKPAPRMPLVHAFGSLLIKTMAPFYIAQAWIRPSRAVARIQRVRTQLAALRTTSSALDAINPTDRLKALEGLITRRMARILRTIPPTIGSGIGSWALASLFLKGIATPDEVQTALRSLPNNPTTEMDLDLWALSRRVAADATVVHHFNETALKQLAQEYHTGSLPPILQQGLTEFLYRYGHRGVAEIDLGLPRWREDPTYILGVLANYLHLNDPALAPDVQFQRGVQEAEAIVIELTQRARSKGFMRGKLVGFFLSRARALVGLREMPKFCLILILAYMREVLQSVGKALVETRRLENSDDIFFLTLQEAHAALAGEDMHSIVYDRRTYYDFEMRRRHIPRVLLSDGTEPNVVSSDEATKSREILRGTPASPGRVTAKARVILDPTGAHLAPGEILVTPSTDPGWTPLFLTAGGLVMEMGGAISHGAVVAREYGIPAVVGVAGATERLTTGQRITVDGAAGKITIEASDEKH